MKSFRHLFLIAVLTLVTGCLAGVGETPVSHSAANEVWTTIAFSDGQIAEVAVDFEIEKIEIGPNGESKMILKAKVDGEELGFSAQLSQFQLSETAVLDPDKFDKVKRCTVEIRSLGPPTVALERRVLDEIRGKRVSKQFRFTGVYFATSYDPTVALHWPSVFNAKARGVTFDEKGTQVPEATDFSYDLMFVIDAPRKRLTVYFSERAGYGGASNAAVARQQWLKSITTPKK